MSLLRLSEARAKGQAVAEKKVTRASAILKSICESQRTDRAYDIFLSHSFKDAELILGVRQILIDLGYSVYVDWIDDPLLDRSNVTPETANKLRKRMNACECLLFATSENSPTSKWMPWELGYFDGAKPKRVAIFPLSEGITDSYQGQEYLGLYPYISLDTAKGDQSGKRILWVQESPTVYVSFDPWRKAGKVPYRH